MADAANYPKVAQLKDVASFQQRLAELGIALPIDGKVLSAAEGSPLAEPITIGEGLNSASRNHSSQESRSTAPNHSRQSSGESFTVGNRWCIHPMEGWDANRDGSPSEHTLRRWRNFGRSGAKLIWGGEAAAVRPDGRANPNQTMAIVANRAGIKALLDELHAAHRESFGSLDGLYVGLQLTHSGRFCKPDDHHKSAPKIAYHHPLLDAKFKIDPNDASVVWTDDELEQLIDDYVAAARLAHDVGYQFVDVKACHGYLLHEFLSARRRPGKFGGDLAGRSRVLTSVIERIRAEMPTLAVGVRLSVFDVPPYQTSREIGRPMEFEKLLPYDLGFGLEPNDPMQIDLSEPIELMKMLVAHGVSMINITCGSPYYNPHIQRPAIFPPFDGYQPPEDPLVGVARQIETVKRSKEALPGVPMVGSGYSYLQDYLVQVGQALVREGWTDFVGLGRMVLSYPELPADTLEGRVTERKKICRTFSDCTTAPRNGLVSGCYPLDPYYKALPERDQLLEIKQRWQA
jgi:2,4-dienoyl-CoA reductase-like NADH-dependent reductase (Old Yellow Enzyme family)